MATEEKDIMLTLLFEDEAYPVQVNRNQYHSLMALISDYLSISNFGICCGMGSCGTCMVKISEKHSTAFRFTLSCQVHINDELANTRVEINRSNY